MRLKTFATMYCKPNSIFCSNNTKPNSTTFWPAKNTPASGTAPNANKFPVSVPTVQEVIAGYVLMEMVYLISVTGIDVVPAAAAAAAGVVTLVNTGTAVVAPVKATSVAAIKDFRILNIIKL